MNAMAVPPPLSPLGEPARPSSRRNVQQGLALSAFVHLSALLVLLWAQAQTRTEEIRLTRAPIDILRPPDTPPLLPPLDPPGGAPPVSGGEIVPTDTDVLTERPVVPKVDFTKGIDRIFAPPGKGQAADPAGEASTARAVNPDPPEGMFVAFDEPPVPIVRPDPAYPDWARENQVEGRVVLHALVGVDGRVRRVTVIRGITGLSESATEALYRWTFRPARMNRQPVAVWVEIPFEFRL